MSLACKAAGLLLLAWCGLGADLRVCADPDNMPYSNSSEQGFENELARLVARDLARPVRYYWVSQRGKYFKALAAGACDAVMEVPRGFDGVLTTRPYFRSSYVFLSRRDGRGGIRSFDDPRLKTLRIGLSRAGRRRFQRSACPGASGPRAVAQHLVVPRVSELRDSESTGAAGRRCATGRRGCCDRMGTAGRIFCEAFGSAAGRHIRFLRKRSGRYPSPSISRWACGPAIRNWLRTSTRFSRGAQLRSEAFSAVWRTAGFSGAAARRRQVTLCRRKFRYSSL